MYKDISGMTNHVTNELAIKNSIKNILLTSKGTVPGKPQFGSNINNILFSQLDHLTESIAKNYIIEAITEFEDRIDLQSVEVKSVPEYNKIIISLYYNIINPINKSEVVSDNISISLSI